MGITVFLLAVVLTIWSGVDYSYHFWSLIMGKKTEKQ
jgi:hypothetical protein